MDRNNLLLHDINSIIESLTSRISSQDLQQQESVDSRMDEVMQATIRKQFQSILAETEKAQTDFRESVNRKIVQQVRISE